MQKMSQILDCLAGRVGRVGALLKIKTLFSHNPVVPLLSFSNKFLDAPVSLDLYHGGWVVLTIGLTKLGAQTLGDPFRDMGSRLQGSWHFKLS